MRTHRIRCEAGQRAAIERVHYARETFELDAARAYRQLVQMKPMGLWYSAPCDEDGWEHWCRSEKFGDIDACTSYVLDVDIDRLLVIDDPSGIDCFEEQYGRDRRFNGLRRDRNDYIDWPSVAKSYAGIEIAPYQWSRRMEAGMWYYSWDCASGCVWDLSCVRYIRGSDHELALNGAGYEIVKP